MLRKIQPPNRPTNMFGLATASYLATVATLAFCLCCNAQHTVESEQKLTHSLSHSSPASSSSLTGDATIAERKLDAPKFYHLNALLYKSSNGNKSPQAAALPGHKSMVASMEQDGYDDNEPLRPLNRGAMIPSGGMRSGASGANNYDGDDDGSSIDSLIRTMRGKQHPSKQTDVSEDEATIQRKSSDMETHSGPDSNSRLRAGRVPRRRRASARQAPPKLKSRRVSRNSRRRKLRHGIKPKRRA